jgi:Tol biopolymer transport system component
MSLRKATVLMLATIVAWAVAATPAGAAFPGENGKISFVSDRAGNPDIWTMHPDGRGLVNLTANSDGFDAAASWSPDGRRLVFFSDA